MYTNTSSFSILLLFMWGLTARRMTTMAFQGGGRSFSVGRRKLHLTTRPLWANYRYQGGFPILARPFANTALQATRKKQSAAATAVQLDPAISNTPFHLVIVESPSKCSTIEKILQEYAQSQGLSHSFVVTSCLGHIRNLPSKKSPSDDAKEKTSRFPYAIAGIDLDNRYQPTYEIIPGKEQVVSDLQKLAQNADKILLATDPDREGEAMAWHLQQVLGGRLPYERISFTEITPSAVQRAVQHPVSINPGLVQAQETRRILDRLAGFTVSPLLWKKIAPGLSAGRVQSVGMALVVQRERERLIFEPTEYASIHASFQQGNLMAQLRAIDDTPVALSGKDFASQGRTLTEASSHKIHLQRDIAADFVALFANEDTDWKVTEVKANKRQQQPPLPYRTSTLQQDVNRRLGLGVQQCMRTAQQLYENGLISYMRTDATYISDDAEVSLEQAVVSAHGRDMYEKRQGSSTKHKKDSKFAQEAHEAIRPAVQSDGTFQSPDSLDLPQVAKDLYRMIYQRTLACRMPNLVTNLTQVTIEAVTNNGTVGTFKTSGSVVLSPGYTAAYGALDDDNDADPESRALPSLYEGQILDNTGVDATEHETQPLPRYTEASFVKELEALGVGRPSTYAGIVDILRSRAYVGSPTSRQNSKQRRDVSGPAISAHRAAGGEEFTGSPKGSLVPSLPAFAVCSLLENHCPTYVDPEFTSVMEERLDHIANSESSSDQERLGYLEEFYEGDGGLAMTVKRLDDTIGGEDLRRVKLPTLESHEAQKANEFSDIRLLVGPWGPYVQGTTKDGEIVSGPLPSSMTVDLSTITVGSLETILSTKKAGGYLLGVHPDDERNVRLKTGRYGPYIQVGEDGGANTTTHSLPKDLPLAESYDGESDEPVPEDYPPNLPVLSFEEAIGYSSLPKTVASFEGTPITAAIGPYGPYLKCNSTYVNLEEKNEILTIGAETAVSRMREAFASGGKRKSQGTLAELGEMEGGMVRVKNGRFGKYISFRKTNVKLPEMYSEDNLPSLEEAWELICEKKAGAAQTSKRGRKGAQEDASDLPPQPKRPPSAYLLFCSANREKIAGKKLSIGESSKLFSQIWSGLPIEERAKFDAEAIAKKQEYEVEKAKWKEECQRLSKATKQSSRAAKSPKGASRSSSPKSLPKRPKSAYLFFCDEKRREVSAKVQSLGQISRELARLWKGTTDRTKYEELAEKDKARYEREKGGTDKVPPKANGAAKTVSSIQQIASPPKRAPSAYMLFCKEFRASVVDDDGNKLPLGETTKRLASMWKSCDSETRTKFEQMARDEKASLLAQT